MYKPWEGGATHAVTKRSGGDEPEEQTGKGHPLNKVPAPVLFGGAFTLWSDKLSAEE